MLLFRFLTLATLMSISASIALADSATEHRLKTGAQNVTLDVEGRSRSYEAYIPANIAGQKVSPLLIVLHGTGSTGQQMMALGRFKDHAEENGYVLVAPNALGRAFNEGSGRGGPDVIGLNDVAFIEALAKDVQQRADIDDTKMFIAGFSSGGSMAQRMALQSDYPWAAIAAVAGHLWVPAEGAKRPTNLFLLWGMDDPLNPRDGGAVPYTQIGVTLNKPSPGATHLKWADLLECYEGEFSETVPVQDTKKLSIDTCYDGARLDAYFVGGLGHQWPGGTPLTLPPEIAGPYTEPFNLTDLIWDFFLDR